MDQERQRIITEQAVEQENANEPQKPLSPTESLERRKQLPERSCGPRKVDPRMKQWPELVGLSGEEAKIKILEDMPLASVHILPEGSYITHDLRYNRVRIFVDSSDIVFWPPVTS